MIAKKLTSLQHPFVKYIVSLRKDSSLRKKENKALVIGTKMVRELSLSMAPIQVLLIQENMLSLFPFISQEKSPEIFLVTYEILKKITGIANPEPIAAITLIPPFQDLSSTSRLLVLDGLSDPGNVGTLLRSALALGWDGAYLTESTCDPFNEKALRAAKGATFRLPLAMGSWDDFVSMTKKNSFHVLLADTDGFVIEKCAMSVPTALILSSESHGPRADAKKIFQKVTIPMHYRMESLNVASAGAILLYGLRTCDEL